jgi:colicin import membrane protein
MRAKQNTTTVQAPAADYPYAEEADIRLLHEQAARHRDAAANLESQAAQIVRETTEKTQHEVAAAQNDAAHYVEQAEKTAAEMVRQAREQADADVQEALKKAAADMQEAEGRAAVIRADRDAALKKYRTWAGMAVEQAQRSGLASVEETLIDGLDVSGQVDGTETTP